MRDPLKFEKCCQPFIRPNDKPLSVVAICVNNPDGSPVGIDRRSYHRVQFPPAIRSPQSLLAFLLLTQCVSRAAPALNQQQRDPSPRANQGRPLTSKLGKLPAARPRRACSRICCKLGRARSARFRQPPSMTAPGHQQARYKSSDKSGQNQACISPLQFSIRLTKNFRVTSCRDSCSTLVKPI